MGYMGGLINPSPGRGKYQTGFSNTGGHDKLKNIQVQVGKMNNA